MKITILGYGSADTPSIRFRINQYERFFKEAGHELAYVYRSELADDTAWEILRNADLIVNQKCVLTKSVLKKIYTLGVPVIFEFDDAIWTRPGKPYSWLTKRRVSARLRYCLENAAAVTVASSYLKEYAEERTSKARVIPMALDTDLWCPRDQRSERFIIGWNGSPHNLSHLEGVAAPLRSFLEKYPQAELHVLCGREPDWDLPHVHFPFGSNEQEFVKSLSVGLIPLDDHPYSHGKSPIKALQYLACGVPAVGTVLRGGEGFMLSENTMRTHSDDDWYDALEGLYHDPDKVTQMGGAARSLVLGSYSLKVVFQEMLEVYEGCVV